MRPEAQSAARTMNQTPLRPETAPAVLALGGLLAMAAGIGIGRFVYTPILPPMVEALSLTKAQAGLIASANFVGYLMGALLAAVHLPGSRRAWLLGSLAVNAVCLAAMGTATTMPLFLLLRLVAGIASAFVLIFSSALVLDRLASAGRSGLSAVHFAGVGIGIALSAAMVATLADWRIMWLASAGLALVASSRGRGDSAIRPCRFADRSPAAPRHVVGRLHGIGRRLLPVRLRLHHHRDLHRRHRARLAGDPPARALCLGAGRARRRALGGAVGRPRPALRHPAGLRHREPRRGSRRRRQRAVAPDPGASSSPPCSSAAPSWA